jgi:putative membrane protein
MMRRALLILGILALAGAWLGPLPLLARQAFFAHMAMHMIVVAIAAPLLALGIAGSSLDPVRRWPALFPPIPISVLELLVVWAWHTPALHHAARHGFAGLVAEQGSFLVCGLLIWLSAFGGGSAYRASEREPASPLCCLPRCT